MSDYTILDWDSEFFGYGVARIEIQDAEEARLTEILTGLQKEGVRLVYWPGNLECRVTKQFLNRWNGLLVDRKTTFVAQLRDLPGSEKAALQRVESFPRAPHPPPELSALAVQSGEYSRFAVDPGIENALFEKMYQKWIQHSVDRQLAEDVLVIRDANNLAGFVTVGNKEGRGDIGLVAVDARFRGRGYGVTLVRAAQEWFRARGYETIQVVTQGDNLPACRLYEACGYHVETVKNFYHFWL